VTAPELKPGEYLTNRADLERTEPCRGCGAPMTWILTEKGRRMPLSVATARAVPCPACSGSGAERCQVCRSAGKLYALLNHWADCPQRSRFSRKKGPSP